MIVPIRNAKAAPAPAKLTHVAVNTRAASTTPVAARPAPKPSAPSPAAHAAASARTYVVKAGDTLYSIAQQFGVAVNAIKSLNHLGARNLIHPGLTLRLPS